MSEISFEYSLVWLVPIVGLSFLLSWWLYNKQSSFSNRQKLGLAAIRFILFSVIGILLLSPHIKTDKVVEEKPILAWLEDHSSSIVSTKDSSSVKMALKDTESIIDQLRDKYDVRELDFGSLINEPSDSFKLKQTDVASAIIEVKDRFYNQNLGAIVLISDGIYNLGSDPRYASKTVNAPIYTLGIGDTNRLKDIRIEKLIHNDKGFLGNELPLEIHLRASKVKGAQVTIEILDNKEGSLHSENITIEGQNDFVKLSTFLKANAKGIQQYKVRVSSLDGEANYSNNAALFTIEVVDNIQKIAILSSSIHPDIGAVKQALVNLEKYEVKTSVNLKTNPVDFDETDLLILYNPDEEIFKTLNETELPYWLIYGPNVDNAAFRELTGVGLRGKVSFEDAFAEETSTFSLFELSDELSDFFDDLPPVRVPFGKVKTRSSDVFLTKRVGNVATSDPLWFFDVDTNKNRYAVTMASGIWRWRLDDYRNNQNHESFDALISNTVQYLLASDEEKRFLVSSKSRYEDAEPIVMSASLYNKSQKLFNEPEVSIDITERAGETYNFFFSKKGLGYGLRAGALPEGVYSWVAKTRIGKEEFIERGSFIVDKLKVEQSNLVADHQLLKAISDETGGKFYTLQGSKGLASDLLKDNSAVTIQRLETSTLSLLNKKWLFVVLLTLAVLEWGLRKFFGKY